MIKFEINKDHLKAIKGKLDKLSANAKPGGEITLVLRKVIGDYQVTILQGIGTVSAENGAGDPIPGEFLLRYRGTPRVVDWEPLKENTLAKKEATTFWLHTGDTKNYVANDEKFLLEVQNNGSTSFAAGIHDISSSAYENAWRTETGGGGEFAPRPLFSHANELFKQHQPEIMEKVREALMKNVNWGA
jgi:hypothetical protein